MPLLPRAFVFTIVSVGCAAACSKGDRDEPPSSVVVAPVDSSLLPFPKAPTPFPKARNDGGALTPRVGAKGALGDGSDGCESDGADGCPLRTWMRENATPALASGDIDAIESVFQTIASFETPYSNWASIALDGADAARSISLEGVRGSCRGCHEQYLEKYKKERRSSSLE